MSIREYLETFSQAIKKHGGEVQELVVEPPATEAEVKAAEKVLRRQLPASLKKFVQESSRRMVFRWTLPDESRKPGAPSCGGLEFDLSAIPDLERGRRDMAEGVFDDLNDPYCKVWHHAFGFHNVPDGDLLALDDKERVIYLSHEGDSTNGCVIGADIESFLLAWASVGCPGPEDWEWSSFTMDSTSGILSHCEAAKVWRSMLGLAPGAADQLPSPGVAIEGQGGTANPSKGGDPLKTLEKMVASFPKCSVYSTFPAAFQIANVSFDFQPAAAPVAGLVKFDKVIHGYLGFQMVFHWETDRWVFARLLMRSDGKDVTHFGIGPEICEGGAMKQFLDQYR